MCLRSFLIALRVIATSKREGRRLSTVNLTRTNGQDRLLKVGQARSSVAYVNSLLRRNNTSVDICQRIPYVSVNESTLLFRVVTDRRRSAVVLRRALTVAVRVVRERRRTGLRHVADHRLLLDNDNSDCDQFTKDGDVLVLLLYLFEHVEVLLIINREGGRDDSLLRRMAFLLRLEIYLRRFQRARSVLVNGAGGDVLLLRYMSISPFHYLDGSAGARRRPRGRRRVSCISFRVFLFLVFV